MWTDEDGQGTGCEATTRRMFAQGHDSRWASWLTQLQVADKRVRRGDEPLVTPAEAAKTVGLAYDIEQKAAKLAAKLAARKTRSKPEPEPPQEPTAARIRVGRWEQAAVIDPDGTARYTTKSGDEKTAQPGSYVVLEAVNAP